MRFASDNLEDWWAFCSKGRSKQCTMLLIAGSTFILYSLWQVRNSERFNNTKPNVNLVIRRVCVQLLSSAHISKATSHISISDFNLLKAFNIKIRPPRAPNIVEVIWHPPSLGWIKCNCDGAYNDNGLSTACGVIFRDHRGNFLLAFADTVPWRSSFLAKFVVVVRAMEVAMEIGRHSLWIETDSALVV
ncbi:uncharacterized protein LOC131619937 [Vicia villosa]|uniref:uncharacterized protein LOC131619937 n=1 Tax=Vicia villosa TaxID=3911 RepID=UPI00273CBA7C|nr:uncharacterized protein LOC131619937 [Vicia villosa]